MEKIWIRGTWKYTTWIFNIFKYVYSTYQVILNWFEVTKLTFKKLNDQMISTANVQRAVVKTKASGPTTLANASDTSSSSSGPSSATTISSAASSSEPSTSATTAYSTAEASKVCSVPSISFYRTPRIIKHVKVASTIDAMTINDSKCVPRAPGVLLDQPWKAAIASMPVFGSGVMPFPLPMDEMEMMTHGFVDKKCHHHFASNDPCNCKQSARDRCVLAQKWSGWHWTVALRPTKQEAPIPFDEVAMRQSGFISKSCHHLTSAELERGTACHQCPSSKVGTAARIESLCTSFGNRSRWARCVRRSPPTATSRWRSGTASRRMSSAPYGPTPRASRPSPKASRRLSSWSDWPASSMCTLPARPTSRLSHFVLCRPAFVNAFSFTLAAHYFI